MNKALVRSYEFRVRSEKRSAPNSELHTHILLVLFLALALSGCVRLSGSAGYWKTGADGNTTAKRASFDTADYVPGSPAPGSVTF